MTDKMREEFETWAGTGFGLVRGHFAREDDEYINFPTQCYWEVWQASRNTGFTAVDMGTAAADGFRDGIAKLNAAYLAGWSASGQGWNGEHPCGACERETWAKDRDADIQKIIAADVSKEG